MRYFLKISGVCKLGRRFNLTLHYVYDRFNASVAKPDLMQFGILNFVLDNEKTIVEE